MESSQLRDPSRNRVGQDATHSAKHAVEEIGKRGLGCFRAFKAFINRDSIIDTAIGMSIALAYTAIVNSIVNDIFSPLIAKLSPDGASLSENFFVLKEGKSRKKSYATRDEAKKDGAVTLNWGNTFQTVIQFFIIAAVLFLLSQILLDIFRKPAPPPPLTIICPFCLEKIPKKATRCKFCTSRIEESMLSEASIEGENEKKHFE